MSTIAGRVGMISRSITAGSNSWTGPGFQLRWSLSTGAAERSVVVQEGPLRIVADARLDNRAGLAAALSVDPHRQSDPELILTAWRRWGERCVDHLYGDFAFAIWDEAAQSLFCARDQFGVAPLYYREHPGDFAFASQPAQLVKPQDDIDQTQALLFVAGIDDDAAATAIAGIRRLPPSHCLRWSRNRAEVSAYWRCEPEAVSDREDFAAGFRERLVTAVEDRIARRPLGAMLSGGLDSSSIVSIAATSLGARHAELQTFSFAYPKGSPFDEADYAQAIITAHAPSAHRVEMEGIRPLSGVADLIDGQSDLLFAPGAAKILRLLRAAADTGVVAMLDGHGGDEVASHGFGRLTELASAGHWIGLLRELMGVSRTFNASPVSLFAGYYADHGRGGRRLSRLARRFFPLETASQQPVATLLNSDAARSADLSGRMALWRETAEAVGSTEQGLHRWSVSWPGVAKGFETLRRLADRAGLTVLFPFYDRRLVTYALAVPESEKLKHGRSRAVLRDAMRGLLPEPVRQRQTKINFRGELAAGLVLEGRDRLEALVARNALVGNIVDLDAAQRLTDRLFATPQAMHGADLFALWRIYALSMWLERRAASVTARVPSA